MAAHRKLRAMPDACLAAEADRAAHLPDAARAFAVVMAHVAETYLNHRSINLFWQFHLAMQLAKKSAMRHNDRQLQGRLQRKIMEIEAQRLRDGAKYVEEIECGHGDGSFTVQK